MINIKKLSFNYGNSPLFNNLDLSLASNKIYGLLGKNGAGKTTLLKIIAGLLSTKNGECVVLDEDTRNRSPLILQEIYFIPETFSLPDMTIEQYQELYSPFYKNFNANLFSVKLEEFEIKKDSNLQKISFGQKKKFLLAFGLSTSCKIFIFDEPTNALDIPSQRIVRKNIKELKQSERIVIISTHYVKEMEDIFDNIIILDNGEIILEKNINLILEKISFKTLQTLDNIPNIVYQEKLSTAFSVITQEKSDDSKIDIELLFNAILNNKNIVKIF